jgi:hypothetical protein
MARGEEVDDKLTVSRSSDPTTKEQAVVARAWGGGGELFEADEELCVPEL